MTKTEPCWRCGHKRRDHTGCGADECCQWKGCSGPNGVPCGAFIPMRCVECGEVKDHSVHRFIPDHPARYATTKGIRTYHRFDEPLPLNWPSLVAVDA
jgi:hypothetical protein